MKKRRFKDIVVLIGTVLKIGTWKALKTAFMLLKIIVPIYILVTIFKYSKGMEWTTMILEPVMGIFNLPGEAAVPIIAGIFTDEYGAIAGINSLDFAAPAITTIAMITLMFHSIPVESVLAQKIGYSASKIILLRFFMAIIAGLLVGWMGVLL